MVATRNHPQDFPEPPPPPSAESPTKRTSRAASANHASSTSARPPRRGASTPREAQSLPQPRASFLSSSSRLGDAPTTAAARLGWSHTPSNLTLIWLAISLPLVIWDTGYVLLRPYSMPGGSLHSPIWKPYELYGRVDQVYGFKAWEAHNGWTLAQGSVNALETIAYGVYLYLVYTYGRQEDGVQGRGAPGRESLRKGDGWFEKLSESRTVHGSMAGTMVLLGYSTALLTFSKTILYWLNEAFSGFDNIGHNDGVSLVFLWIIPNGAWIVFPAYMMYIFGQEMLQGLDMATHTDTEGPRKKVR